mgnify:CR=1 FL=1
MGKYNKEDIFLLIVLYLSIMLIGTCLGYVFTII